MSQGTSIPSNGMYDWPDQEQNNGNHQTSYPAQVKPYDQVNSLPVQRFDSTGASDHANDPYNVYSTASNFNYHHPTPGGSAEDLTQNPEIHDLYWQETYNDPTGHVFNGNYNSNEAEDSSLVSFTEQLRSARNSLPSPESTNVATPDASGHSQKPSLNSTIFTSPLSTPIQTKYPLTSLNTGMSDTRDSQPHLETPGPSSSRIVSPSIHISRHSRGDSPARSDFPRLGNKRSASNLSQGEYFPEVSTIDHSSMLAPPTQDRIRRSMDEVETGEEEEQRGGIDPAYRGDEEILNFEDIEKQQEHEIKVSEVQSWLRQTTLDSTSVERRRSRALSKPDRIRSRSTGARPQVAHSPIFAAQQIPGPGQMIDEQSDYHYSSDSESSLDSDDHPETIRATVPERQPMEIVPEQSEPSPKQFFRPRPWQDPFMIRAPDNSVRFQPDSSSAAIYEFMQRVKDSDSASRAATWGTSRRRMSDGDKESLHFGDLKTRHLSLSKRTRERGSSILHKVQEMTKEQLMKRSNSHIKRQQQQLHEHPELEQVQSPEPIDERSSSESMHKARQPSYPRPSLSPSISAGLLGATNSLAAVGAGSHGLAVETEHHESLIRRTIRRVRSRSDVNKSPKSPHGTTGFTSMLAQQGGMPVPSLASPSQEVVSSPPQQMPPRSTPQTVTASVKPVPQLESPVKMDLSPQPTHILPTLDGFKLQIVELNPRLEPYLVDRIAHDQIKRYKRLVKNKVDHMALVAVNKCPSGELCSAVGGEAEILPIRATGQNMASISAQFKVAPGADSDNEDSAFDGIVTPAAFPEGIPLPPTKKLPAKFECPLCFQVKSFQKPSDWTKHVHEDVQPFTCTFPNCSEPKSFKRKADWVRHENERHRHLEWWSCNISECSHKCYRKDNFVQHLVREHKRKEPKVKGRVNGSGKGKGRNSVSGFNQEEQDFWNLVDTCRHEGATDARHEPCKFCNNTCASWKKLSVHVGKHMEQIAMPVLDLAKRRNVTKDTIISPVEPLPSRNIPYLSHEQGIPNDFHTAVSPHTQSGTSNYQSSSASHSPAAANRAMGMMPNQALFRPTYVANGVRQTSMGPGTYGQAGFLGATAYTHYIGPESIAAYSSYPGQQVMYAQAQLSPEQYIPRARGIDGNYVSLDGAFEGSPIQPYYSSPEMEHQTFPYATNMMAVNGSLGMAGQPVPAPVMGQGMGGNMFMYTAQQGNPQQQYSPY